MADETLSIEDFMKGDEVPEPVAKNKPFKDEDFPEYVRLVKAKDTTPDTLNSWLKAKGYGAGQNAEKVLAFTRDNPNALIQNSIEEKDPDGRSLTESLGLGVRNVIEGAGGLADVVAGPVNSLINALPGEQGMSASPFRDAGKSLSDWLGFAVPQNDQEKLITAINEGGIQGLLTAGAGSAVSGARGVTGMLGKALASSPVADTVAGAVGMGASEKTKQEGYGPVAQIAAGLVAGGVSAGVALKAAKALAAGGKELPKELLAVNEAGPVEAAAVPAESVPPAPATSTKGLPVQEVQKRLPLGEEGTHSFKGKDGTDYTLHYKVGDDPGGRDNFPTPNDRKIEVTVFDPEGAEVGGTYFVQNSAVEGTDLKYGGRPDHFENHPEVEEASRGNHIQSNIVDWFEKKTGTRVAPSSENNGAKTFWEKRGISPEDVIRQPERAPNLNDPAAPTPTPRTDTTPSVAPPEEIVGRLTEALNDATKLNAKQRALYREERSTRLRAVLGARNGTAGEAGFRAELSKLKGEMPKVQFEGVRQKFEQGDIDTLFDSLRDNRSLSTFDQINARTGLGKLLDGQVPTPKEVDLLGRVFPKDFVKAAIRNRDKGSKVMDFLGNALNLPRSMMSTLDMSAPFRQGLFLVGRKEFWGGFQSMFKQFGSERAFRAVQDDIRGRQTYPLMEESGLSLTDMGTDLTAREEAFVSEWAERIPVYGKLVKASGRAYSGFLNKVRADTFDSIVQQSRKAGVSFHEDPKALADIARFVNSATGRGDLGKLAQAAPLLNGLFFSPRLIASRVNMLNPAYYATLSPVVRKEAIKSLLSLGAIASTVTGIAVAGGAEGESDPRSSDFAKLKVGDTRFDILGGFGQYLTLGARLATAETKTLKGDVKPLDGKGINSTRKEVGERFFENKFAPIPAYVRDFLAGSNPAGEEFDAKKDFAKMFIPLFVQDFKELMDDPNSAGPAAAIPGIFGVGTQTYERGPTSKDFMKLGKELPSAENSPPPEVSLEDFMKGSEVK